MIRKVIRRAKTVIGRRVIGRIRKVRKGSRMSGIGIRSGGDSSCENWIGRRS